MYDPNPHIITEPEWLEISGVPLVRERWGLPPGEHGAVLKKIINGTRFHFIGGYPRYEGDLFVLVGAGMLDQAPVLLVRAENTGRLVVVAQERT